MDAQQTFDFRITEVASQPQHVSNLHRLIRKHHLQPDTDIQYFIEARAGGQLAGCAGLAGNIVKCVVTDTPWRGVNLTAGLLTETERFALKLGRSQLFLCTRPENAPRFRHCGFWPVARDADRAVLMENSPVGLQRYCRQLQKLRQPGKKIAAIVMNANPFTLGHRYLAELAASQCNWLHLFLVREEGASFSYADRLAMVTRGVAHLPNVTVHGGSPYIISRATFPAYFLKEQQIVDQVWSETDLMIFRDHIAPALGITHRYIGSEPFCQTTNSYNRAMQRVFSGRITVEETERKSHANGIAVSASEVRRLLAAQDYELVRERVPRTTFSHLEAHFIAPDCVTSSS